MNNEELIISRFKLVKSQGYIPSHRSHNTGIGKTFEDLMGVPENNLDAPDLAGYEIKSHRELSQSYITLLTRQAQPKGINKLLYDTYGYYSEDAPNEKRLYSSFFMNHSNTYRNTYAFQLVDNPIDQKIYIIIKELATGDIVNSTAYYSYQIIERCFAKKLKKLFYVSAETQIIDKQEYFHYTHADIYENPSFENFLDLIRDDKIMYDFRMGVNQSGPKIRQFHDHGSGFRIKKCNLHLLYSTHIPID